jgi:hypothetical protein
MQPARRTPDPELDKLAARGQPERQRRDWAAIAGAIAIGLAVLLALVWITFY